MAKVNFNLKDKTAKKQTLILLVFNFDNQRIKVSTGLSISASLWNTKSQRVRELLEFPSNIEINQKLEDQQNLILKLYAKHRSEGVMPDANGLKNEFLQFQDNPSKILKMPTFWDHFENFIDFKRRELREIKDYNNALRKHLKKAEEKYNKPLSYGAIKNLSSGFIETLEHYLAYEAINSTGEKGMTTNSVGKQLKNLKVFLNWSFDRDIFPRFSLRHIICKTEEVDNIYITEKELESLVKLKLTDSNEKTVRDLFIIGCETALRFSDFTRLSKEHIKQNEIHIRPKKTQGKVANNKVVIPISTRLQKILEKYNYNPPNFDAGKVTDFNKTIRDLCEKAEINDNIIITKKIAGKTSETTFKKFQLVSSHTCRRTFCTLKFLDKMPAQIIMRFSGHKTDRAFLKYLKLDAEMAAKQYIEFFK
ncbi:MAG: tyrosine-type recombinase/integrase [Flavobacteriales bacterium]|nr:tyrosine-type recombinase/integrase [Flavobacteriales bacterium]